MAFGFRREPGTGRGYVNESNPDLPIGTRLSRRQYDKFVERLGERRHMLRSTTDAIRSAEENLAATEAQLREIQRLNRLLAQSEAERAAAEAEIARLRGAAALQERQIRRASRQGAGQRRYNTALDMYVLNQREKGRRVTKREAAKDPAFRQIMDDLRGTPNPTQNPNIKARNKTRRLRAFDQLGGARRFRELYDNLYGPARATRTPMQRQRENQRARERSARRRARG